MIPPIPQWDGMHVLIVHFPVALLLAAPVLLVLGLVFVKKPLGFGLLVAAFVIMLMGTISAYFTVSTGKAAGKMAIRTPEITQVITLHESLATATRNTFTVLTIVYGVVLFGPMLRKKQPRALTIIVTNCIFLLFYMGGVALVSNTAHQGGRLVHELGVQAFLPEEPASPPLWGIFGGNEKTAQE